MTLEPLMANLSAMTMTWLASAFGAPGITPAYTAVEYRSPTHVACVGDSITAGAGASNSAHDYPSVLSTLLGGQAQVANFGHGGATLLTSGDLPYVDQPEFAQALEFAAAGGTESATDVVIVLGANDSKSWNWRPNGGPAQAERFVQDYRNLVARFAALPTHPRVYLGLPLATGNQPCCGIDGKVIREEEVPLLRTLGAELGLPVIDLYSPTADHPEYFTDGIHPNDEGYRVMARVVFEAIISR